MTRRRIGLRRREVLALAVTGCASGQGAIRAGDFSVEETDGSIFHLAEYRGKVVMVLFFASYDQRSLTLMLQLTGIRDRWAEKGLVVLCLSVDGPNTAARVKQIARTRNIDLPIAIDADTSIVAHYNPKRILPYVVFFGREGRVVDRWLGHDRNDREALEERIATLTG